MKGGDTFSIFSLITGVVGLIGTLLLYGGSSKSEVSQNGGAKLNKLLEEKLDKILEPFVTNISTGGHKKGTFNYKSRDHFVNLTPEQMKDLKVQIRTQIEEIITKCKKNNKNCNCKSMSNKNTRKIKRNIKRKNLNRLTT